MSMSEGSASPSSASSRSDDEVLSSAVGNLDINPSHIVESDGSNSVSDRADEGSSEVHASADDSVSNSEDDSDGEQSSSDYNQFEDRGPMKCGIRVHRITPVSDQDDSEVKVADVNQCIVLDGSLSTDDLRASSSVPSEVDQRENTVDEGSAIDGNDLQQNDDVSSEGSDNDKTVSDGGQRHRMVIHHAKAFNNASIEEEDIDFSNAFNPDAYDSSSEDNDASPGSGYNTNRAGYGNYDEYDMGGTMYEDDMYSNSYNEEDCNNDVMGSAGAMANSDTVAKKPGLIGRQIRRAKHCVKTITLTPYVAASKFTSYCKKKLS
ncbi:uncharacterized protein BBOV_IV011920 [Babesia bovis T2Bo]|uniref:Uncharacterized protein n=1 Tax=Babesia bovis TaxID=5865 RepID=A7ASM5_BABBO|nr:uncharacterized protein BBOV_IV011920 [Babesia bovis T2Bo]EDO07544.1 hypothetical protein BBOV_IV011920 [Babesia bovis T2Bo]|eukprot:XP_001611112.1 hypothetical protein [Babesia bovis T2Bo]